MWLQRSDSAMPMILVMRKPFAWMSSLVLPDSRKTEKPRFTNQGIEAQRGMPWGRSASEILSWIVPLQGLGDSGNWLEGGGLNLYVCSHGVTPLLWNLRSS